LGQPFLFALQHALLAGGGVVASAGEVIQPVREVKRQFACRAAATAAAFGGGKLGIDDDFSGGGLRAGNGLIALGNHIRLAALPEGAGLVIGHGGGVRQDDNQLGEGRSVRGRPRQIQQLPGQPAQVGRLNGQGLLAVDKA